MIGDTYVVEYKGDTYNITILPDVTALYGADVNQFYTTREVKDRDGLKQYFPNETTIAESAALYLEEAIDRDATLDRLRVLYDDRKIPTYEYDYAKKIINECDCPFIDLKGELMLAGLLRLASLLSPAHCISDEQRLCNSIMIEFLTNDDNARLVQ